jgi:hypothetical protein
VEAENKEYALNDEAYIFEVIQDTSLLFYYKWPFLKCVLI